MHNNKQLFTSALEYTARKTGFSSLMIEKDYYCSLCLKELFNFDSGLIFKGGTLLNKVHCGFYRLSEDLDFLISISPTASRSERRQAIQPVRSLFKKITQKKDTVFSISKEFTGYNESKQYIGEIQYYSEIMTRPETIKIDVGLREEIVRSVFAGEAQTILIDPLHESLAVLPFKVRCLSLEEAFAEKIRAALTRKPPAIRDLFDLAFASSKLSIDFLADSYLNLAQTKIETTADSIDVSSFKKELLTRQLETELRPVLRDFDYKTFDFESSFELLAKLADNLRRKSQES